MAMGPTQPGANACRPSSRPSLTTRFDISINIEMKPDEAVLALGAPPQQPRLDLSRRGVPAGADGMAAGAIAETLGVPNSSLSFHLAQLRNAGLILQERQHRSLIYRANYPAMNALVDYLTENCCAGAACGPEAACEPIQTERKSA